MPSCLRSLSPRLFILFIKQLQSKRMLLYGACLPHTTYLLSLRQTQLQGIFQQSNISLFFFFFLSHFRLFDDTFHLYHCFFCRLFPSLSNIMNESMSVMYVFCWCSFKKLFSVEIIVSQGLVSSDKSLQDTIVSLALVLMCAEFIRLSPKWVYEVLSTQWGANAGLFFFSVFFSLFA